MNSVLRLLLIVCLAASAALGQKMRSADAIAKSGSFKGQLYTNTALGFTMLAPGGWTFYTAEQNNSLVVRNRENAEMSGDEILKTSAANTQVLFQAMPPQLAGRHADALFSCGVESLVKPATTEKYIAANRDLVLRRPGVTITKNIHSIKLGDVDFSTFDVEGTTDKGTYRQKYYVAVRKNAALFCVITLYDNKQDAIVEHSLRSIKFQ